MAAGSCGAIQGAIRAKITKMTTSTTPAAASGLWPAARRNEMAAVDMSQKIRRLGARRTPTSKLPHLQPDGAILVDQLKIRLIGRDEAGSIGAGGEGDENVEMQVTEFAWREAVIGTHARQNFP